MGKLISIIVPIYNVEKYLDKCIESILNQTYKNLEIILVDDGSKDNCPKICDDYKLKDLRVKVIHKENAGVSSARNSGLNVATGEYIGFVDPDDYIEKDMYEKLIEQIEIFSADIVMCGYRNINLKGSVIDERLIYSELYKPIELSKHESQELYFTRPEIRAMLVVLWNKLFDRKIFNNHKFPIDKVHEDEALTFKLLYEAKKIVYLNEALYNYLIRNNSIMAMEIKKERFALFDAYLERVDFYLDNKENNLCDKMVKQYMRMFCQYIEWSKTAPDRNKIVIKEYHNKLLEKKKDLKKVISLKTKFEILLYSNLGLYFYIWKAKNSK